MSIAGGFYRAAERAAEIACDTVQLFLSPPRQWPKSLEPVSLLTKNNSQWRAVPITDDDVSRFRGAIAQGALSAPLSHASYLINLASPDDALRTKSIDSLALELQRATQLGIASVVVHPGSHLNLAPEQGLERVVSAINAIHERCDPSGAQIVLENTAGQGSNLGWQFEQLGWVIRHVAQPQRVGICLDTCHAFAAGYVFESAAQYRALFQAFESAIGLAKLRAIHLNDSKREPGARVDRHEHIGRGHIGIQPFWRLLRDPRLAHIPMYLETPKDDDGGHTLDARNMRVLRALAAHRSFSAAAAAVTEDLQA